MHVYNVKTVTHKWGALLLGVLLASSMAFYPAVAQAAATGWGPFGGGSMLPGFWVTGEVTAVEGESVTVQLPNHHHAHGMMRFVSLQVTLAVDSNSVLLNDDLGTLELATLAEGDEVVVMPGLVWGNLVARLIFAGEPEELADASYRGKLVEEDGDTLTIKRGREEIVVQVDDATVWYENGPMERPAELAEEMTLRVIGVEEENAEGDDIIRAVLITPGR